VGGSLADVLERVAATITERQRLSREIRVLTAQGRMSGIVLTLLPFVIALAIWFMDPAYMTPLWTTTAGRLIAGAAALLIGIGAFLILRIIQTPQ